jgi:uncharacterized protein YkwD
MRFWTGSIAPCVAALFFICILFVSHVSAQETVSADLRELALKLVNEERASHELPPLRLDGQLTRAAQADDMLERNYYSHNSPEGVTVSGRYVAAGGYAWLLTAENIAKCEGCKPPITEDYVRQMHEGWMNSPGHRANILREGLTGFGYGLVIGKGDMLYAVQTFSGPGTPHEVKTSPGASPPKGNDAVADETTLSPSGQLEAALVEINRRRKANGRSALRPSPSLSKAARNMLPPRSDSEFKVDRSGNIYDWVPAESQGDWARLTAVVASCGGCGAETVGSDAVYFTGQWLGNGRYTEMLMDAEATHFGFAMAANGKGKKVGVGLLGEEH